MSESGEAERKLALLIDGDNAQYKYIEPVLKEASRYGMVTIRRAYGDWMQPNLANWRQPMLENAIQPIQQMRYTTGKNATDSALIIDAMDILYSGTVQGFCIVSSDSDFTRLCTRISDEGLFVMGIGHKQITPPSFIRACEVFVFVENLIAHNAKPKVTTSNGSAAKPAPKNGAKLKALVQSAFDTASSEDGWVHLGSFGSTLKSLDPNFDSRTYGFKTLSLLVKGRSDLFEVRGNKKDKAAIYVRPRKK